MISDRTKLIFSIGFVFGTIVIGVVNYVTFMSPRWARGPDGTLSTHDPSFSGFPFAMYMDGYTFSMFLADGLVGNVVFGLALCTAFGWLATKIPGRKRPLK